MGSFKRFVAAGGVALAWSISTPLSAQEADSAPATGSCLSLERSIDDALAFDPRIVGSQADRAVASADLLATRSRDLPQITAFGQYGDGDPPIDGRTDGDQYGIQYQLELYSFGSRKFAKDASEARLKAAKYAVTETRTDVAQGVALAYLDYLRTTELARQAVEQEATFEKDAKAASSRLDRRVITLTDASQIRSRYARSQSDTVTAEVAAATARMRLEVLIDRPFSCMDEGSVERVIGRYADRFLLLPPEQAVDEALATARGMRRARAQVKAAQATVKEASRANMPTLSLNGFALREYEESRITGQNELPPLTRLPSRFEHEERIALTLSQELFTGGRNKARRADARARLRGAQADLDLERLIVTDLVKRSLIQAKAQKAAQESLLEASQQAQIRLTNTTREYDLGTKTLTDLVLATEDYFTASALEVNARFEYYSSVIRLYGTMGMLLDL